MRILDIISSTAKRIAKQYPNLSEEVSLKLATDMYKAESLDSIATSVDKQAFSMRELVQRLEGLAMGV